MKATKMGDDSRSKRILADLSSALRRDKKIDEFDFIYCPEPVVNRSPVVLENHKLGLQTWSIKILYDYVYTNLMEPTRAVKDLKSLNEFSRAALLLNPECYSIWNMRKELVTKCYVRAEDELQLATLIQTKHPKSPETFIQRRWLLQQLFPSAQTPPQDISQSHLPTLTTQNQSNAPHSHHQSNGNSTQPLTQPRGASCLLGVELTETQRLAVSCEIEACRAAADHYPSNYNAWSHRIWVLQRIARLDQAIVEEELEGTMSWVKQHISDHSGFNYRHFLVTSLLSLSKGLSWEQVQALVQGEMELTASLILSFPGHEAIWYHRRSVISAGRAYLQSAPDHIRAQGTLLLKNPPEDVEGTTNGHDVYQEADAELVEQGEGEWLLLKDYASNTGSPPHPKTPRTECRNRRGYDHVYHHLDVAVDDIGRAGMLDTTLLETEASFMEAANDRACKGDRPLQQRCIERHRRWLDHLVQ